MMDLHSQGKTAAIIVAMVLSVLLGVACNGVSRATSNNVLVNKSPLQMAPSASATDASDQAIQQVSPILQTQTPTQETSESLPSPQPSSTVAQKSAVTSPPSPVLCKMDGPEVYMVFKTTRYHIADWDTFLNLGYVQSQITSCGPMSQYAEGAPIRRLVKGSGEPVYWMENGAKRHIPDMETFDRLGFWLEDISVVPDEVLASWPLGQSLTLVGNQSPSSPMLCKTDKPEIYYMVFDSTRYSISSLETLEALGHTEDQLASCGSMSQYAEGVPITRLLKGSGEPVYWMTHGFRRQFPEIEALHFLDNWWSFEEIDISVVPDKLLVLWPLGMPFPSAPQPYQESVIGAYTIRLFHPLTGYGMYDMATITSPGQPEIRISEVAALGVLPATDITGEGEPDVMFETYGGGSHCCWGTVVYNLGSVPSKVLEVRSTSNSTDRTGKGIFQNLDSIGAYEFITRDPLSGIPCTQPEVKIILQYEAGRGYVGASPRYAALYAEDIARHTQYAETRIDESKTGYKCGVYEVIVDYLYSGQVSRARDELLRLYLGTDVEEFWLQLQQSVSKGRFYVPPVQ